MHPQPRKRRREARFRALLRRQHGAIARRQMLELGFSHQEVKGRRARGELVPVDRGVMVLATMPGRRATAEAAAWLAVGRDGVVSGRSAARRRGLLAYPSSPDDVEISIARGAGASRAGIVVHRTRTLDPSEREILDGVPTASVDRTLLDLAARATGRELEGALATALDRGATSRSRLRRYLGRRAGWPGTARLRSLLDPADPPRLTRSPPEERLLALVRQSDLPDPLTNHRVGRYELDLYWPEVELAVEYDSRRHHLGEEAFEHDRLRDARLAADHAIAVLRVTGLQLAKPAEVIDRVRRCYRLRVRMDDDRPRSTESAPPDRASGSPSGR